MFDTLHIENFQGHKRSNLYFCPGVNIIAGHTDSGKSSIVRALQWLLFNKPSSDSFRTHGISAKDLTRVVLGIGDHYVVERRRGGSVNEYAEAYADEGGEETIYKALRSDVPEEIQNTLRISPVNVQTQFEGHFLLTKTPGEVARYLNKIVELEAIDAALKKAANLTLQAKTWNKSAAQKVEDLQISLESLDWLDDAETLADAVQVLSESTDMLALRIKKLSTGIASVQDADVSDDFWFTDEFVAEVESLSIEDARKCLEIGNQINKLDVLLEDIDVAQDTLDVHSKYIDIWTEELAKLESQLKVCPTCNRPL